ncbi:MAG TPA: nucleotidyltransferase domain-containing protein [Pirellulaceae bacterium]
MTVRKKIQAFVDEVVRRFQPEQVVLFGSYAYGTPDEESDVDLLVVMPHRGHSAQQAAFIRQQVRAGFPLDLIVRSPAKVRQRIKMGDSFLREILSKGKVLHEAGCP